MGRQHVIGLFVEQLALAGLAPEDLIGSASTRSPVAAHPDCPTVAEYVERVAPRFGDRTRRTYAKLHDSTVREAFERYQRTRVDIDGQLIGYDSESPTAQAEWVRFNLGRVMASLPNGYCGRPPQQDCPHPNACLTCPDFQTTVEFLDIHRRQVESNATLLAAAEARGNSRLADNHRRVQESLERIIATLETVEIEDLGGEG